MAQFPIPPRTALGWMFLISDPNWNKILLARQHSLALVRSVRLAVCLTVGECSSSGRNDASLLGLGVQEECCLEGVLDSAFRKRECGVNSSKKTKKKAIFCEIKLFDYRFNSAVLRCVFICMGVLWEKRRNKQHHNMIVRLKTWWY